MKLYIPDLLMFAVGPSGQHCMLCNYGQTAEDIFILYASQNTSSHLCHELLCIVSQILCLHIKN